MEEIFCLRKMKFDSIKDRDELIDIFCGGSDLQIDEYDIKHILSSGSNRVLLEYTGDIEEYAKCIKHYAFDSMEVALKMTLSEEAGIDGVANIAESTAVSFPEDYNLHFRMGFSSDITAGKCKVELLIP